MEGFLVNKNIMGKEVCKYFRTDIPPEEVKCGFARWLIEKPTLLMTVPNTGCGKTNIGKCPRITSPDKFPLDHYGSGGDTETKIAFPVIRNNDKGEDKRLPGGIFK